MSQQTPAQISIEDRFRYGFFDISEICALARKSRATIYMEIQNGVLKATREGRRTRVRGTELAKYLGINEPAPEAAEPADEPAPEAARKPVATKPAPKPVAPKHAPCRVPSKGRR